MNKDKVLLVEDALDMQRIVKATLADRVELSCASNVAEAEQFLSQKNFDLIVLDVVLPDGDGFTFCKKMRSADNFKNMPVIFLTGEGEVDQRVQGFTVGGDDYIVKPFEPAEFIARVVSKLKRKAEGIQTSFTAGPFRMDLTQQRAYVIENGESVTLNLTPIEFKLLLHFVRHEDRVCSREDILKAVWGENVHVSGHTVDTHISSMRKKVGSWSSAFRAIPKPGYCFSTK